MPPSYLPLRQVVATPAGDVGIVGLEVHQDGWVLRVHEPRLPPPEPTPCWEAEDDTGHRYAPGGGGGSGGGDRDGGGGWMSTTAIFTEPLHPDATSLRLRQAGVDVTVVVPRHPTSTHDVHLVAAAGTMEDVDWRSGMAAVEAARATLGARLVPDEVAVVNRPVDLSFAGTVTLLALERWGGLVRLHHHWVPDDPRAYADFPLRGVVGGLMGGGGTTRGGGYTYTLDLALEAFPTELRLRLP